MSGGTRAALLADGRRLHLQHGPIDLVIGADGDGPEVASAYRQAVACFEGLLARLVEELDVLRRPIGASVPLVRGPVARRMVEAVRPHAGVYVTPMAAVAGAVAEEVLAALVAGRRLGRAYVNNRGDIALHLAPGTRYEIGVVGRIEAPAIDGIASVDAETPVRGIATSGRAGRSLSLGIADSVSVLASGAAPADAAATLIANAVDIDHPAVSRRPARAIDPDTDLGDLPVTVAVDALSGDDVDRALAAGATVAERMREAGLIEAAHLGLFGRHRVVGGVPGVEARRATG